MLVNTYSISTNGRMTAQLMIATPVRRNHTLLIKDIHAVQRSAQ